MTAVVFSSCWVLQVFICAVWCSGYRLVLGRQHRDCVCGSCGPAEHPVSVLSSWACTAESSASWWQRARTGIRLGLKPLQSVAAITWMWAVVSSWTHCWGMVFPCTAWVAGGRGRFNFQTDDPTLHSVATVETSVATWISSVSVVLGSPPSDGR